MRSIPGPGPEFAYHCVAVPDAKEVDLSSHLAESTRWAASRTTPLLVYCVRGISRSVTVALAILMRVHGLTLWDAWQRLKAARPVVCRSPRS